MQLCSLSKVCDVERFLRRKQFLRATLLPCSNDLDYITLNGLYNFIGDKSLIRIYRYWFGLPYMYRWPGGTGVWPDCDPWGKQFSPSYHPRWWRNAGRDLAGGWKAAFDGVQADQEWIHKVFKLKRSWHSYRRHMFSNIVAPSGTLSPRSLNRFSSLRTVMQQPIAKR